VPPCQGCSPFAFEAPASASPRREQTGSAIETWAAQPVPKKALVAREGAVDELIDDDEIAGRQLLLEAATAESEMMSVDAAALSARRYWREN